MLCVPSAGGAAAQGLSGGKGRVLVTERREHCGWEMDGLGEDGEDVGKEHKEHVYVFV